MDLRTDLRWVTQHGVVRLAMKRAAKQGDLQARSVTDLAHRANPYPLYRKVRERGPLVRGRLGSITATHAVVTEALRNDDLRAGPGDDALPGALGRLARWARDPALLGPVDPPSLLVAEPPDHTRMRRTVSRVFTARAIENLRARTEQVAADLLDRMTEPRVELIDAYCSRLPVVMISEILGVRPEDHARVLAFGRAGAPSLDIGLGRRQHRAVEQGVREFSTWLTEHLARVRREPGDDLFSQLAAQDELSDRELRSLAGLVLAAGFETTVNLLGSGTVLLTEHPDQLARLQRDAQLWPNAVDEVLRYESPVQVTARFAVRATEVAGHQVQADGLVVTMLGGANRDPAVFADPDTFDVGRANAREHVSFSSGRHFCLGAALARLEGEVGLRALFDRFPGLALEPGARRTTTRVLRGWEHLPVRTA